MITKSSKKIFTLIFTVSIFVLTNLFTPIVNASTIPPSRSIPNDAYAKRETLQPLGTCVQIDELKNWSPDKDPDARYNKGSIPLKPRIMGPLVNPYASTEARVMTLNKSTSESQGTDTANSYAFNYFQYLDSYNFWGGTKGRGIISIPTPEKIDAAHRNGVKVTGTIFLPWGDSQFVNAAMTQLVQKDTNGKYVIADKLIEIAEYYGFDGYFINQESSVSSSLASKFRDMLKYIQQIKPNNFIMQWYDSMLPSGTISYQNTVNSNNIGMIQQNNTRYNDEVFINFNWNKSRINTAVNTMTNAGRNPFDVFASWENIPYDDYNNHPGRVNYLLDQNNKIKTSIGILGPDITLSAADGPEDFTNTREGILWVGPTLNPTDTAPRASTTKFPGMSSLVGDKTPIIGTEFTTHFTTGNGHKFYEDGVVTGKLNGWSNCSLTDTLPTWRWIVDSNGSKLNPSIDYSDAYWGGTSLKVEGNLESENPNHIKLYSTKLDITSNSILSITYKTPLNATNMKVGLCFGNTYDDDNFVFFDVDNLSPNQWNTQEIDLSQYDNQTAIAISLKFESDQDISDYSMNIGRLAITTQTVYPASISNARFDEIMFHDFKNAEARIYWSKAEYADFYEIHRVKPNGDREFVGATPNNAFYLSPFERNSNETDFDYEITPVSYSGGKGTSKVLNFKWSEPLGTAEPIDNTKRINLAYKKDVTSNVISEPGQEVKNLVDGIITSSKWCVSSTRASVWNPHEATIDLGSPMQVGRWVVYNANCPGANEGTAMNTIDYKLKYSTDGINFTDADVVTGNSLDITDRNLQTPITARYFRLSVTRSDVSPWSATRVYELELYSDNDYVKRTQAITPHSVTAKNNIGATDTIKFDNVPQDTTIKLYNSLNSQTAIAQKLPQQVNGITQDFVEFSDLDLGSNEGRIYYSTCVSGMNDSLRRSVAYYAENGTSISVDSTNSQLYNSTKGLYNTSPFGVLIISDLPQGAILKVFSDDNSLSPILISAPADECGTIRQERVPLQANGGNLYLEISASGYKSPDRTSLSYGNISSLEDDNLF